MKIKLFLVLSSIIGSFRFSTVVNSIDIEKINEDEQRIQIQDNNISNTSKVVDSSSNEYSNTSSQIDISLLNSFKMSETAENKSKVHNF